VWVATLARARRVSEFSRGVHFDDQEQEAEQDNYALTT
jgi:hypothetical protein